MMSEGRYERVDGMGNLTASRKGRHVTGIGEHHQLRIGYFASEFLGCREGTRGQRIEGSVDHESRSSDLAKM